MKSTRISFIVSRYRAVSDYKLASDSLQRFRRAPSSFQRARSSSLTASVARVNSSSTYNKTRIPTLRFLSTMGGPGDGNDKFDGGGDLIEDEEEFGGDYDDEFEDSSDYYDDDIFDEKPEKRKKGKKKNKDESGQRIWLDPSTPLEDRVNRFLNQGLGTIHPLDIALASVDLIRECGKTKSFEGLNFGHDILDRLLEEKRFVNESSIQSGITSSHPPIVISERPFQVLMYGWSNLSSKVSLAPQRMREILDLMIKEAEYDESIKEQFCSTLTTKTMDPNKKLTEQELDTIFADRSCQPTVDIYNTLLQGLVQASRRSIQAAGEAEKVLIRMNKMNRKRGWHTKVSKLASTCLLVGNTLPRQALTPSFVSTRNLHSQTKKALH